MHVYEGRLSSLLAKILKMHFKDAGEVPYTEIAFEAYSLRFFLPKEIPRFEKGEPVRFYFNDKKTTWSLFCMNGRKDLPWIDVAFSRGTLDWTNTTATVMVEARSNGCTVVIHLSDGDVVFDEEKGYKSVFRGGRKARVKDDEFYASNISPPCRIPVEEIEEIIKGIRDFKKLFEVENDDRIGSDQEKHQEAGEDTGNA